MKRRAWTPLPDVGPDTETLDIGDKGDIYLITRPDGVALVVSGSEVAVKEGSGTLMERRLRAFSLLNGYVSDLSSVLLRGILDEVKRAATTGVSFSDAADLSAALKRAEAAHAQHEKKLGKRDEDWSTWYAKYLMNESAITQLK